MAASIPFCEKFRLPEGFFERWKEAEEQGIEGTCRELERAFCETTGAAYALTTSSSTAALHLAMCALDLKRGDKIICSVNSFVDVPEVVRHFDAEPIFVDCDPRSYNLDLDQLEKTLEKHQARKLRAVVVNHMAGLPADMDRLAGLAEKYDVHIVEDATDAPGASYKGRSLGSFGAILSVFSLGSKTDGCFDGGILTTCNEACYERAELLRNHAMIPASSTVDYLYDVLDIGCQYRMSEYDGVLARMLFDRTQKDLARRKEIAEIYFRELAGLKHVTLPVKDAEHTYSRFIVEIDKNRDAFARKLKERGVGVGLHYLPLHTTRYYKEKYSLKLFDFPQAMGVYQRVMSLPNRPELSDEEIVRICAAVRAVDAEHI